MHSPEVLNLVLVDFKGGATFATLDRLPHTSEVITNLAAELSLVDRMHAAISSELVRRQELLRSAGNFASQRDYERARASGIPLAPLPSLLLICDEFSELLSAKPEFIDMFVQIGRVGRSLGVHLLLASQRLEEGRLRGLEVHLSYRIGLRTFSAIESRVALGVPDAAALPRSPGHGYLKYGTEPMTRFKAAYVSGAYRGRTRSDARPAARMIPVARYGPEYIEPDTPSDDGAAATAATAATAAEPVGDELVGESVLDILVGRMAGHGPAAHQVWLPPLADPAPLDRCLPALVVNPRRGLTTSDKDLLGRLRVPVGFADKPLEQRREVLWLELAGAAGHLIVVGGPQSGRSTLARTLVCGLALTHTPAETQFYCLDFGGGALLTLRDLPHVGGAYSRLDVDQVRRTVAEVHQVLRARERSFAAHAIDSMDAYQAHRRADRFADDPHGDVFLLIDGWGTLRADFEDLEPVIADIATRGLSYGVHLVATATRWMELRHNLRDLFGTTLELHLGDPVDSAHGRKAAANVPPRPGHGLSPDGLHFLTALPRIDGSSEVSDLGTGVEHLVKAVRAAWSAAPAPRVRLLPDRVDYQQLPQPAGAGASHWQIPIGIAETDLAPVALDFGTEPHCILFGDVECGKTTFLRTVAAAIAHRYTPDQACIVAVDYRRNLIGHLSADHLIGYASNSACALPVTALDARSGTRRWQKPVGQWALDRSVTESHCARGWAPMVVCDALLANAPAEEGQVRDVHSGTVRWTGPIGSYPLTTADDTVLTRPDKGLGPLVAIDLASGAQRWRHDVTGANTLTPNPLNREFAGVDNRFVVAISDPDDKIDDTAAARIVVLDTDTGQPQWSSSTPTHLLGATTDGVVTASYQGLDPAAPGRTTIHRYRL